MHYNPHGARSTGTCNAIAVAVVMVGVLVATACATTRSAAEGRTTLDVVPATPTVDLPFPAPTSSGDRPAAAPEPESGPVATTAPIPTVAVAEGTPTALAVPEASSTASPTIEPTPTATPRPIATPRPTATAAPTATDTPTPVPSETPSATPDSDDAETPSPEASTTPEATSTVTVTATPTPVVTVAGGIAEVGIVCERSPTKPIDVGQAVEFRATQQASVQVSYVFDFGDGRTARGRSAITTYNEPRDYVVTLRWSYRGENGVVPCGTVSVILEEELIGSATDFVGLSEAEANALATERTLVLRVTRRDLILLPGTTDFRLDRINVELDAGFVTAASIG